MKMQLYRVAFKVRPAAQHPKYWEIQFGFLLLYLWAESAEQAGDSAATIVGVLPYEVVGRNVEVIHITGPDKKPELERCAQEARSIGFCMSLVACQTGTDEGDFAGKWEQGES